MSDLVEPNANGLYCATGDFYIDPWKPVPRAVVTHAHSDHARAGCARYLTSTPGRGPLALRVGAHAAIDTLDYGADFDLNGVRVSLHPAGHLLGSAQVRLEHRGHVTVVTGDYKTDADPTCAEFELVRCDTFITESTFGLPVYRWPDPAAVRAELNAWWRANADDGATSILYAYALGKAQRLLGMLDASIGTILLHGAVDSMVGVYRDAGIDLPPTVRATAETAKAHKGRAIVIAPLSANGSTWVNKFRPFSAAFASGWMAVRGSRRRRAVDRGFVVSDHVDWPALHRTIDATGATRIGVTHGYVRPVVRWLREEHGLDAYPLKTRYEATGEADDAPDATDSADAPDTTEGED